MAVPAPGLPPKATSRDVSPETASVKQLLRLLDRMAKSSRTYGATNAVAIKFFTQFCQELFGHLEKYPSLSVVVQRSELHHNGECVYSTEESLVENLAFKLYSDGIRELSFQEGATDEDVRAFLDALWGAADGSDADDDIVTRLWSKNLSTIQVVTAEDLVKLSVTVDQLPTEAHGFWGPPPTTFSPVLKVEQQRLAAEGSGSGLGTRRTVVNAVGYEVSEDELRQLGRDIARESSQDHALQIIEMLKAIVVSERTSVVLDKAFELFGGVHDALLRAGNWVAIDETFALLRELSALSEHLTDSHRRQIAGILNGGFHPDCLKIVETVLNRGDHVSTEGLEDYLGQFSAESLPALCALLGGLQVAEHRALVTNIVAHLAKDHPETLLRALTDKRPPLVKSALSILMKWNDPRYVEAIEKLVRYPDPSVRREVLRAIMQLRPEGPCNRLVAFVGDDDELIRLNALKALSQGTYQTTFEVWDAILQFDAFYERPPAERRSIYQALRVSVRDGAVPYWKGLLADWGWTGRQRKEEIALIAVDSLHRLGTGAAREALEHGQRKGNSTVRDACTAALSNPPKKS